jgi:hypothetical protein
MYRFGKLEKRPRPTKRNVELNEEALMFKKFQFFYCNHQVSCFIERKRERGEKKVGGGSERHYRLEGGVTET